MSNYIENNILSFIYTLPESQIIIGYGSGVKPQNGYKKSDNPSIDLIVAASNPKKFHEELIKNQPNYYPLLLSKKYLLGKCYCDYLLNDSIDSIPFIKHNKNIFKITVTSYNSLIDNLITWNNYLLPGRLQKPIKIFKKTDSFINNNEYNRLFALKLSLLLLKENNYNELLRILLSLSYIGTPRQNGFENPNKINNIITANQEELDKIYNNYSLFIRKANNTIIYSKEEIYSDISNTLYNMFGITDLREMDKVISVISEKNYIEERNLALNGILTAGERSINYGIQKLKKAIRK